MAKRVFIAFHMDDRHAKELLTEQARSDRFELEFVNYAVNEPFDEKWKTQCKDRIAKTSVTICLIGERTHLREAVNWELETSYALDHKVFGVRIYRDKYYAVPRVMREHNAKIINWDMKGIVAELESD